MLLTKATVEAISEVASGGVTHDDVDAAFRAYGFAVVHPRVTGGDGMIFIPGTPTMVHQTIANLDLADTDVVGRLLRVVKRLSELHAASPRADMAKLVRARNALEDDGFTVEPTGDVLASLSAIAAVAAASLDDTAGIRMELGRLDPLCQGRVGHAVEREI